MSAAERAVAALISAGATVAIAESLTGGLVCASLTSAPGASAVVRGGVIVYATDLKSTLAGVAPAVLDRDGPVAPATAFAMADGVRHRLGADVGVATTGVAGPDPQAGRPPGTVYVAVVADHGRWSRAFVGEERLDGDRSAVRAATVTATLELIAASVEPGESSTRPVRSIKDTPPLRRDVGPGGYGVMTRKSGPIARGE